jgi:diguanylate cyclase (GGDEF)-like protein/PAS domain S-box-containing protein
MNRLADVLQRLLSPKRSALDDRVRIVETALESMGDGVAVVDGHGKFLLFNSAARRIYGREPLDGAVERWTETYGIFRPDRLTPFPPHELPLARALRGEASDQVELVFRNAAHPEGICVASTGRPLRDADNRVHGGIVVLRDISRQKQAEVELRDTNQRLSHLVAEQSQRAQQSRILAEMSSLLQTTATVDELYTVIGDYFERLYPNAPGAFFVYSASRDDLEQRSSWGGYPLLEESSLIKPSECWGLRRGRAHRLDSSSARMRCAHVRSPLAGAICAPVLGPSETIGLLHVRFDTPDGAAGHHPSVWDDREQILVTAAEYLGLALVNLRLRLALQQQSIRDPLTGLFNRRFLEETLTREIRRAQRNKATVSVLMLDIDHFKMFNDRYGHAAGDVVLREFSTLLGESIRGADVASRYGGEEFTVLLPDTSLADARAKAQQLLERIKALRLTFNGLDVGVMSASIGIAASPVHGEHIEDLLRAVDAALYAAKQRGRDRVEVFERNAPVEA